MMKVGFCINDYDKEGDVFEECIKLYCNDTTILVFKDITELMDFGKKILSMEKEIRENLVNIS